MRNALLIIDVQQALCAGPYAGVDAARVIARINEVAHRFRAAQQLVVMVQHEEDEGPLQVGSAGWQLADGLAQQATDVQIRKRATDAFHQTDLQQLLQSRGISALVIGGLQTEFCVDTTTRRALALGYHVQLIADGHTTMDSKVLSAAQIAAHHNETLANITSFGPRVTVVPGAQVVVGD